MPKLGPADVPEVKLDAAAAAVEATMTREQRRGLFEKPGTVVYAIVELTSKSYTGHAEGEDKDPQVKVRVTGCEVARSDEDAKSSSRPAAPCTAAGRSTARSTRSARAPSTRSTSSASSRRPSPPRTSSRSTSAAPRTAAAPSTSASTSRPGAARARPRPNPNQYDRKKRRCPG